MFSILKKISLADQKPSYSDIMAMNALDGHPFVAPPECNGAGCTGNGAREEGARKIAAPGQRNARALMRMIDAGNLK
jgi:hypothetical protein